MTDIEFIALCVTQMLNGMKSTPGGWVQKVITPWGSVVSAKKTGSNFVVSITTKSTPPGFSFLESMGLKGSMPEQPSTTTPDAGERQNVQNDLEEFKKIMGKLFQDDKAKWFWTEEGFGFFNDSNWGK